jgi:hypothetical protein
LTPRIGSKPAELGSILAPAAASKQHHFLECRTTRDCQAIFSPTGGGQELGGVTQWLLDLILNEAGDTTPCIDRTVP